MCGDGDGDGGDRVLMDIVVEKKKGCVEGMRMIL